ncbi:hypothetical protein [Halovivax cerinus]|uniref:Uncharacterized protein n=1 Tax=Halovivax cerinus TaxID=1487865 RepID=A0ABD5NJD2_9EURY|nr:hypothetical protein [Halovivax cerinus]
MVTGSTGVVITDRPASLLLFRRDDSRAVRDERPEVVRAASAASRASAIVGSRRLRFRQTADEQHRAGEVAVQT